jgi:hypothetical protein
MTALMGKICHLTHGSCSQDPFVEVLAAKVSLSGSVALTGVQLFCSGRALGFCKGFLAAWVF